MRIAIAWVPVLAVASWASPAAHARPVVTTFDSPEEALASIVQKRPRVIAFGEYHEVKGAPKVPSAIARFTERLLPRVAAIASEIVVETWVTEGNCGKQEEKVVEQVAETTKRPETTEDEIVTMLKRAKASGLAPNILTVTCKEYRALLDDAGELDLVRLLRAITVLLARKTTERLRETPGDHAVLIYGGALHNDVYPRKELRQFSFASELERTTRGRYLEVDLYVPEYIELDKQIAAEPWFKQIAPDKTTLVKRGANSYILVFPRTPAAPTAP
jgi:hypothetical protein